MLAPAALVLTTGGWSVVDMNQPTELIPVEQCGDINIQAAPR
jgi:hypothetical protein